MPFFSSIPRLAGAWFQYLNWLIVSLSLSFELETSNGLGKLTGIISCFGIIAIIRTPIPEDENNDDEEE